MLVGSSIGEFIFYFCWYEFPPVLGPPLPVLGSNTWFGVRLIQSNMFILTFVSELKILSLEIETQIQIEPQKHIQVHIQNNQFQIVIHTFVSDLKGLMAENYAFSRTRTRVDIQLTLRPIAPINSIHERFKLRFDSTSLRFATKKQRQLKY